MLEKLSLFLADHPAGDCSLNAGGLAGAEHFSEKRKPTCREALVEQRAFSAK